jgi:uncharacterized membrane protein YvlD (DUF360 family)
VEVHPLVLVYKLTCVESSLLIHFIIALITQIVGHILYLLGVPLYLFFPVKAGSGFRFFDVFSANLLFSD